MATYFDVLPDDLLLILLKKNKTLKDVNSNFKRIFDGILKRVSEGLIQPIEYFIPVVNQGMWMYSGEDCTIEGKRISEKGYELDDLIDKIIKCNNTITYYSGNISFVCQTDIEFYYDILGLVGISPDKIPAKTCYLYLDGSWSSKWVAFSIYVDITWKNFWNMKLDRLTRRILMSRNGFI